MTFTTVHSLPCPTPEQLNELTSVWEASVRATHSFLTEADIKYFKPLVRQEFLPALPLFVISNPGGSIAGFMGVAENNVEMLFVHPDARGKGIGRQLLLHAIQNLGARKVDVNEQNQQATGFYLRFGFRIQSRSETDSLGKPFPVLHLQLEV